MGAQDERVAVYDCAGRVTGTATRGEDPAAAAARELAEELGVTGVPLAPLDRFRFDAGRLRHHVFTYEARSDGPLRPQPEEVVADPVRWPFVPDGRMAIERWLAAHDRRERS